jgi:ribonuclease T1
MSSLCESRRIPGAGRLLVAALVLIPPASADAGARSAAVVRHAVRPADLLDPPLAVERFPAQVEAACHLWKALHWPSADRPLDYPVADTGLVLHGSTGYGNRSGDLPATGTYREYDVNPRPPGRPRDAERVVRDNDTHTVWYTGDHYANFREIVSGCP